MKIFQTVVCWNFYPAGWAFTVLIFKFEPILCWKKNANYWLPWVIVLLETPFIFCSTFCICEIWKIHDLMITNLIWIFLSYKIRAAGFYPQSCYPIMISLLLTLCMMGKISADNILKYFSYFQENKIWHFMQIVSFGENMCEMSDPIF